MRCAIFVGVCLAVMAGCDGGGGSGEPPDDAAGGERSIDPFPDQGTDAGADAAPLVPDAEPLDAAPLRRCVSDGVMLGERYVSDPSVGLEDFIVDVDGDQDGLPDLVLRRQVVDGLRFELLNGQTAEVQAGTTLPNAVQAEFMPRQWPPRALRTPINLGDEVVWFIREDGADGTTTLGRYAASTFDPVGHVSLGAGVQDATIFIGPGVVVLVNRGDGSCAVYDPRDDMPRGDWGRCRVWPGWDLNGDGVPDIVRSGAAGLTVFDGLQLLEAGSEPDVPAVAVGLGPDGPLNLRGQGPEVASATLDQGRLEVRYHDPVELNVHGEAQTVPVPGIFERVVFIPFGDSLRLVAQLERNGQRFVHLLEPGPSLRRISEFGPYIYLNWDVENDVDGDGVADLRIRGGSTEDGTNTEVQFRRLRDGELVYSVAAQRSARFTHVWSNDLPPTAADLDGCPGIERVLLREGNPTGDGVRPTRVLVFDDEGVQRLSSEGYNGRVHVLRIADLDGEPPAELIEVRSEDDRSARLRVFSGPGIP
ncbi:MAG: hypothetical protein KC620_17875 [Myxococcales bacterium]|nr:hypothetical protein [Myxococcales bacterium]